jgi:porin
MGLKRLKVRPAAVLAGVALGALALVAPARAQTANTGPLSAYGDALAALGVVPNLSYTAEFATNPSGGAAQGGAFAGQVAGGVDADLQKLVGLTGGALHVQLTDRQGQNLANTAINNSVSVQEIYGAGQTWYLTTLTYEQKLWNGLVNVLVGRTALGQVALQDPIYCQFQSNAICGEPDIMGKITNATFYPVPVWGGLATIRPTDRTYLNVGLFDNAPEQTLPRYHGLNFSITPSQGVQIPLEAGYQTSFANDAYPRRYDVGVIFDRSPYSYTTYDPATRQLGATDAFGRTMLYFQAKQMVYRPEMDSQRGLTLFGALVLGPDAGQPSDYSVTLGAVYQGPFAARPQDSIGVAIGDTHYREAYINQLYAYRVFALGGSQRPANDVILAEIHYRAAPTPWLNVMPNIQYIANPDGLGAMAYPRRNLPNAFVFGLQVQIDVSAAAGLSRPK